MTSPDPRLKTITAQFEGVAASARLERTGWELDLEFPSGNFNVAIATHLLNDLTKGIAAQGGGLAHWRVPNFQPEHTQVAKAAGYGGTRTLVRLGRPLPVLGQHKLVSGEAAASEPKPDPPLETRPFVPGIDDAAWLETNNAAFSWHPEQSNWTPVELAEPMSQPWFDPQGFLLYPPGKPGGPIDGFCWTKLDSQEIPVRGEIFIIATHPRASGQGLGKKLVLAGLEHLHQVGAKQAYLYTETDNQAALALYLSLGFMEELQVRVYKRQIEEATQTRPGVSPT